MVALWAEKEARNLKRMKSAGMRVPIVYEVKNHVLVMEFLGNENGEAAPRLKDAEIPIEDRAEVYKKLIIMLREMYQDCKLVHADFSEYNIL